MPQVTTAGRLLHELLNESPSVLDMVVRAAGLNVDRADASMDGSLKLSLSEQLRLSEATILLAPKYTRNALRLRGQILAARSYENGDNVEAHRDAPVERWERSQILRR